MGCRGEVGESSSSRWQPAHSTPPAPCTKGTYRHNGHTESLLAGMYFYSYTSVSLFVLSQTAQQLRRWMILRAKYSPVNPPLTSPTLLRQAVRAFVSNNDLKKSYGEHESIHSLLCIHHERRNVFWTDQQLVIRIDPIASQLNAESALTGIAANTSLHDVSRYQQYQKFFYF